MKMSELHDLLGDMFDPTVVKVLLPNSEVHEIVDVEFEPDNQQGNIWWIKTELAEG